MHESLTPNQRYITGIFRDIKASSMKTNAITETYGEILYEGMEKLLKRINLTKDDRFIDLGSGLGKIGLQVYLNTPVSRVCGIEINPLLHQQALIAQQRLTRDHPLINKNDRELTFIHGSFLDESFDHATVALVASPCYGPSILHSLGRRFDETHSIRTVLSLRPIPSMQRLTFKKIIRVECSWDTALCYIYA